jgi:polysaccharide biosynthesis transport protein
MRRDDVLAVLWRRKWTVVAVFLALTVTTAVVSKSLPEVYSTSSILIVAQPEGVQDFSGVQAAQAAGRSYAEILKSENFSDRVAARLGGGTTSGDLDVSIEPISETQLISITAEADSPSRAKEVADTYAQTFVAEADDLVQTTQAGISVAELAPLPEAPARPKPTLYTLAAALFGLGLGVGLALLRERLDTRLRSFEDVEEAFDVPVLARVPPQGRTAQSLEAFTEAFRVLRTNLQFASHERRVHTIAITSWSDGEGKTTTCGQLSMVTASTGTRVLAVDADLRRPSLQPMLVPGEDEPLEPGLSNLIVDEASINDVIYPTHIPALEMVPSGPPLPSLESLLDSERGAAALRDLSRRADFVILDTPPLAVGADAAALAARVDGVVLVVELERATETGIREALRRLESVRARVLGLVLNRDRSLEQMSSYYYSYKERQKERPSPEPAAPPASDTTRA